MTRGIRRAAALGAAVLAAVLLAGCASGGDGGGDAVTDKPVPTGTAGAAHFDDYALVVGEGDTDVRVWFDPRCPYCKVFEEQAGPRIAELVESGELTYSMHLMNFLDRASAGTAYSSRAGSALTCVAVEDEGALLDSVAAVFAAQPKEGTAGLTDDELAGVLRDAGASGTDDCVADETYTSWVQASNDAALAGIEGADIDAIEGTPTLIVNGVTYTGDVTDGEAIVAFIESGGK